MVLGLGIDNSDAIRRQFSACPRQSFGSPGWMGLPGPLAVSPFLRGGVNSQKKAPERECSAGACCRRAG
jgi:hypothetical protein